MAPQTIFHSVSEITNSNKNTIRDIFSRSLHDLRISVIDRCNFRCTYCMPSETYPDHYSFLQKNDWLNFDEIEHLIRQFVKLGVTKVRITGGEPLLRDNLSLLIQKISAIPEVSDLALTTNGTLLQSQAHELKKAGLTRITVSLDTLDDQIFRSMNGNKASVENILKGIRTAEKAGFESIKINAVIQKGINDSTVLDLIKYFKGTKHIIRFIEYMDVGNRNHWKPQLVVPSREILNMINAVFPLRPLEANYHGEVAERYEFTDGGGEIGFISSITQPFCGSCTRARLSTDGKFYTCLFASKGFDLRTPLRGGLKDEGVLELIKNVWQRREDRYSETRFEVPSEIKDLQKIEMYQIGG